MSETAPPTPSPRPRRRVARRALAVLVCLLALLACAALGARLRPDLAGAALVRVLAWTGVRVEAASLELRLFPPGLESRDLTLRAGEGVALRARVLLAEADPWLGLGHGPVLAALEARGLEADVTLTGAGQGAEGGGVSGDPLSRPLAWLSRVGRVALEDASVRLAMPGVDVGLSGLQLDLAAPSGGAPGREVSLRGALRLEPHGPDASLPAASCALAATGRVGPGGSVTAEVDLTGTLEGALLPGASVSGDLSAHALVAWDVLDPEAPLPVFALPVFALDVSALDVSVSDFQAAFPSGARAAGSRAWLQAGLRWRPGRMPDVQRAHLAVDGGLFQVAMGTPAEGPLVSGGLDLEAELRSGEDWLGSRLRLDACRVRLTDLEAVLPAAGSAGPLRLPLATVEARGGLDPADLSLSVDRAALRLGRDGEFLEAVVGLRSGPGLEHWRADLAGRSPRPDRVLALLAPLLPRTSLGRSLRGLSLSGPLPVHAAWRDGAGLTLGVEPKGLRARWPAHGLSALLEGRLGVALPPDGEPSLSGELAVAGGAAVGPLAARRTVVRTGFSGSPRDVRLTGLRLDAPPGGLSWRGAALPNGLSLRADVALDLEGGGLAARDLSLAVGRLGSVSGSLDLPLASPLSGTAALSSPALDLRALAQLLQTLGLAPATWPTPDGAAALSVSLEQGGEPLARVRGGLRGVTLATDDQRFMVDGLGGGFSVRAGLSGQRPWRVSLDLDHGQALADTVFLDLTTMPLSLELGARGDGQGGQTGADGNLRLGGLGALDLLWGSLSRRDGDWSWAGHVQARDLSLPGLLETFVRQPLAFSHPDLASLSADLRPGGAAALDLSVAASPDALDLSGRLTLRGADAAWSAKGVNATALDLDLPFAYTFGAPPLAPSAPLPEPPDDEADWGGLHCRRLVTPTGVLDHVDLSLALVPGGLFTRGELAVPVLGGRLVLGALRAADPLSAHFRLAVPVRLDHVDLSLVRPAGVPLAGRLSGDLGLVRADASRLEAPGSLRGSFFGGDLTVSGLAVHRPLDQGRVVGLDRAEVHGLDLEHLSTAMGLGRVTGRMDVSLAHAAVAWGQPQRMDLRIESVDAPGVRRLVSLKAVNSISVIGTGSGLTDAGVGVFAGFFKEFGYDRIGISCTLRNDVFRVRGLIREGSVEYLIKKPLFFGINVINQNPDNRIGFSDMMERIGRVVGKGSGKGPQPKQ